MVFNFIAFFNAIPHLPIFVQLESVWLALRSPVMIILSVAFLMLCISDVIMEDAGGI